MLPYVGSENRTCECRTPIECPGYHRREFDALRKRLRMSVREAAAKVGMTSLEMGNLIRGRTLLTPDEWDELATHLEAC